MATSAGLAWSLANGITQEEYDKNLVEAYKDAVAKGLTDAQIESGMNQWGISAADVARALGVPVGDVQKRLEAATPTTAEEIAYNKAAMDELAGREAQWAKQQQQNAIDWAAQQKANEAAWAAQQKANADAWAKQQAGGTGTGLLGPTGATSVTGTTPFANATQGFASNFANYQSIPIGAQYNPNVTAGGASPYSQIMGQMRPFTNPYAGVVAGQAMGGYNPGLYDQIAAANVARAAAANAGTTLADYYGSDANGGDTAGIGSQGGDAAGNTGGGPGTGAEGDAAYAMGGMVNGLFGMNPPGPDDGAGYLDRGEYVIKKSSVNKYGRGLLDMINEGKVPAKKMKSLLG